MELRGTKGSGFYPMIGISDIPISPPNEKNWLSWKTWNFYGGWELIDLLVSFRHRNSHRKDGRFAYLDCLSLLYFGLQQMLQGSPE